MGKLIYGNFIRSAGKVSLKVCQKCNILTPIASLTWVHRIEKNKAIVESVCDNCKAESPLEKFRKEFAVLMEDLLGE